MLDIGCGNGAFLRAFGRAFPQWELAGTELNGRYREDVLALEGVTQFHVGDPWEIAERFDFVSMVHVLEHIASPGRFLQGVRRILAPGGALFIEVPDAVANPFDLMIADHSTHFWSHSLRALLGTAGLVPSGPDSPWIAKELSLLSRAGETVVQHGVTIMGPVNLASTVPFHASQMFAKNIVTLLQLMIKDGKLQIDMEDEVIRETVVAHDGEIGNPRVREALGLAETTT